MTTLTDIGAELEAIAGVGLDDRISRLEVLFHKHLEDHRRFEEAVAENTALTKEIAANTGELVALVKGAKGLRSFLLWIAPIAAVLAALWAWLKLQAAG